MITPGNLHDVMAAPELLSAAGSIERLVADKAYDTNRLRRLLAQHRIEAVIPLIARRSRSFPMTGTPIASATSSNACSPD